ncbi:TIGR03767 family metallophosphoesterase [Nocardiopsis sp. FIRDI 009]|uniref:TIGR03767 family metallophosphoesterase n=1 Tax=Nocardiopsis sp. FIRDI 009 TaxID=714197 RepID=UPI000E233456|nr:TIGR03767 family metallophosphoesterase [Nocardiopsis sp. FIRDI 009]
MTPLNRRGFLTTTTAGLGAAALGLSAAPASAAAHDRLLRQTMSRVARPDGTTLAQVATPVGEGYRLLTAGPGWPIEVREDLVPARAGRDDRRTALAAFVQFTDLHIMDAQSPVRFEYTHPVIGSSAHRPQEALSALGASALVKRVNSVRVGPVTGRPFDFMVTTGDNTDNHETVELEWLMTVLNGGTLTPNTGDPARYEGVQNCGSELYWQPDSDLADRYKARGGFPTIPGFLAAAVAPFESPGLDVPWYCTIGNHDDTPAGTLPAGSMDEVYLGDRKIMFADDEVRDRAAEAMTNEDELGNVPEEVESPDDTVSTAAVTSTVTPDDRRAPFDTRAFVAAHLDGANTGPGPVGHGFTDDNVDGVDCFYTFRIADGVTGVSMDTTTLAGLADGSIGKHQFDWLERTLRSASSVYYDFWGRRRTQQVTDELFVLFSHHTSGTMGNILPDSRRPGDLRLTGDILVHMLKRYPNVLAWVNGHTHHNRIQAHTHRTAERGFWEINTASHIDHPQMARAIEIVDNEDGTMSLFTTLLEADSPYRADHGDFSADGLASLYRELSVNDLYADPAGYGGPRDRNVELLVAARNPAR